MSDVLPAAQVYEIEVYLGGKANAEKARRLSDSHEQLRGERDAARQALGRAADYIEARMNARHAGPPDGCPLCKSDRRELDAALSVLSIPPLRVAREHVGVPVPVESPFPAVRAGGNAADALREIAGRQCLCPHLQVCGCAVHVARAFLGSGEALPSAAVNPSGGVSPSGSEPRR